MSSFPIILKNNIHPIITTCSTFLNYSRSRMFSLFRKLHRTTSKLFPYFETSVKHLLLGDVSLQGSKCIND